jgi:hypothetical protein
MLFMGALIANPQQLFADANLNDGVLTITHAFQIEEFQLQVGPVPGQVVVLKSPGVVDGTVFSGVHSIVLITGNGVDKVDIKAELSSNLDVTVETGQGGDEMKVDMKALPGSVVNAGVEVIGTSGENKLEWKVDSEARELALDLAANTLAGVDTLILKVESDTPSDRLAVNVVASTGTSDDKIETVIKSAAAVVNLVTVADTSNGSDTVKLELDQLTPGNITANFNVDLSASSDNGEIILKGNSASFVVNGLMKGGDIFNDSLKLLVEGPAAGAPVLDGGTGQDSCTASLGTTINCE